MSGMIPRAYIGIANGSPWVVPSHDNMSSPATKRRTGFQYVLTIPGCSSGHSFWMLAMQADLLRQLNASASSTP